MRSLRIAVVAVLFLASASPLRAQEQPLRSYRHMAVGTISFLNEIQPALHGGYLYQVSLSKSRVGTDEFGAAQVFPPHWFAHALVSGGWSWDADSEGDSGFSGIGQLGLVRRLDVDWPLTVSRVGLAAQGSVGPEGYGAVTRLGLFHGNAAVSVGWMHFPELDADRLVVTVDLLRCILQDLGLVDRCVIR